MVLTLHYGKCKMKIDVEWTTSMRGKSVSLNKALQLGDRTFCCYLEVDNAFTNLRLTLSMLASCLRKFTLRTKRPENRNEMEKQKSNK